jgi:hypothetical protein
MKHPLGNIFLLSFLLLEGCLGGAEEELTNSKPIPQYVALPMLKLGDKWVVDVTDSIVTGGTGSIEVTNDDTTFDSIEVYEIQTRVVAPDFLYDDSLNIRNFSSWMISYVRKSDQEELYHLSTLDVDVSPIVVSSAPVRLHLIEESKSKIIGAFPNPLQKGMSWTITEQSEIKTSGYSNGTLFPTGHAVENRTKSYTAGDISKVTVPAGTFRAIEIDENIVENGESKISYFSEEAKTRIKETTKVAGVVTSSVELKSISLAK